MLKTIRKQLPVAIQLISLKNYRVVQSLELMLNIEEKLFKIREKFLTDYINYNNQRLKNIKGSGFEEKNKKRWTSPVFQQSDRND